MEKETCTFSFCAKPEVVEVETDILLIGGGMACCGAAYEATQWAKGKDIKITMVDKAATDRSGAVAMGLSAINTYMGENDPKDYVKMVRDDLMGITGTTLSMTSADTLTIPSSSLRNGDSRSGKRAMTASPLTAFRQEMQARSC